MSKMLPTPKPDSQKPQSNALTMWLARTHEGGWVLERLVASNNKFTNTISIAERRPVEHVLAHDFVQQIISYLPRGTKEHVLTASDFIFEIFGLTLNCLRVTGQRMVNGVQRVMLTFRRVLGDFTNLFQVQSRPDALKEAQADLSTRVLAEIITPALNLVESSHQVTSRNAERRVSDCLNRLRDNKHELMFYSSLLVRFVNQADTNLGRRTPAILANAFTQSLENESRDLCINSLTDKG